MKVLEGVGRKKIAEPYKRTEDGKLLIVEVELLKGLNEQGEDVEEKLAANQKAPGHGTE